MSAREKRRFLRLMQSTSSSIAMPLQLCIKVKLLRLVHSKNFIKTTTSSRL